MKQAKVDRRRRLVRAGEKNLIDALDFLERYGRMTALRAGEKGEEPEGKELEELPIESDSFREIYDRGYD